MAPVRLFEGEQGCQCGWNQVHCMGGLAGNEVGKTAGLYGGILLRYGKDLGCSSE